MFHIHMMCNPKERLQTPNFEKYPDVKSSSNQPSRATKRSLTRRGWYTLRVHEFLRMNPPSFTRSSTNEDPKNFVEELNKVCNVMHVVNAKNVELAAYKRKSVSHHLKIGIVSKKPSWGESFLENWRKQRYGSSSLWNRTPWVSWPEFRP